MMEIRENQPLAPLTTFGIGGPARYFAEAATEEDVVEAVNWARERGLPLFVLGGGSNLLVRDSGFAGLVLRIGLRGVRQTETDTLTAAAGEPWDELVDYTVKRGLAGMECLAGIPGLVGGTPVQNVGAYGQEVSETIVSVRVFDLKTGAFVELTNAECRFRYRGSLFNTDERERYIVASVTYRLKPGGAPNLRYADLQRYFQDWQQPSLSEVAAGVRQIRRVKGMLLVEGDPDCRSAGSFFKNPIIAEDVLPRIAAAAGVESVPHWPAGERKVKLPAAWLLERAGFTKGFGDGAAGISSRHTLALVNRGGATFADVERLEELILAAVREKFGVRLEQEPVVVG